ncbi:hypothetical protein [Mucilaginibacter sp. NFR10]|uniref:hypothetical protein n=1 Tax=Mucilaginibacter sp. NFR10 TaxID=1566292 RepID=UPI0008714803|nr:hypothetical protein [Mucilaginibacter sp. NFR10]SCW80260.1 hypothetical protein SAMN03159284_04352 [Mucilaginibacter sp. NFR10]
MDKNLILLIGALAGLAGALITQLFTGLFSYLNDMRKQRYDLRNQFRLKRLDIGENFYFINTELLSMVRKNIDYWRNLWKDRNDETLAFMKKEMGKLDAYQAKLRLENWKYNVVDIYFNIPFNISEMEKVNELSRKLYVAVIDFANKIQSTPAAEREELFKSYNIAVFNLCSHYEQVHDKISQNISAVKAELLLEFQSEITMRKRLNKTST